MVETMVVLLTLLVILFGFLDLGLAVIRHNALSEAARRLAREAIVHGEQAAKDGNGWGPASVNLTAAAPSDLAEVIRPVLPTLAPADVTIDVQWPDGDHKVGSRVRVTVTTEHRWITPLIWGGGGLPLSASSTMRVAF